MSRLGKRLINAAKSAQAIAKGEADPEAYGIHVPAHLDVRAIRTKLKMSLHSRLASTSCHPRYAIGNKIGAIPTEQRASS